MGTAGAGGVRDVGGGEDVEVLASRARGGDMAALEALLARIDADGTIRVEIRRTVINAEEVEDISQDVLIVVAEQISTWDGRAKFGRWVRRIAHNKAVDHLRRIRPTEPMEEEPESDSQRVSSLIATRVDMAAMLQELPAMYREPVMLRDVDHLEYEEIAALLDMPAATVRTRVSRGRAMLAAHWTRTRR